MKFIITESQLNRVLIEQYSSEDWNLMDDSDTIKLSFKDFNNDWEFLQKQLKMYNYNGYIIIQDDLNLSSNSKVTDLGKIAVVMGDLDLSNSAVKSLGSLQHVLGDVDLSGTEISSFGDLDFVGGHLYLEDTPLSKMSNRKIKTMLDLEGEIFK